MRWWVWLLLGLARASLTTGASIILPPQLLKQRRCSAETFGGPLRRHTPREATPSLKQAIICDIINIKNNRYDGMNRSETAPKRPACLSFASLRKLNSLPNVAAAQHFFQRYRCERNGEIVRSKETKCSPLLATTHMSKRPVFANPTRISSFVEEVEGNAQEVSSQDAHTNSLLPPRGFRDFPPDVLAIHKHIFSCWHEVAAEFGFMEYKGPSVERYSLYSHFRRSLPPSAPSPRIARPLEMSSASAAVSVPPHIYRLQVDGPEPLCLRPELTPSLTRMLQREHQQHPSGIARRWYSVERVWRHEKPGCGRRREHFQWNLDIALPFTQRRNSFISPEDAKAAQQTDRNQCHEKQQTGGSPTAEFCSFAVAELIAAAVRLLQKLGLSSRDVRIRVGSRSLLRDLLWAEEELRDATTNASCPPTAKQGQVADNRSLVSGSISHISPSHDGNIFQHRLTTAMQVLDRASRRSQEETVMALASGLGITAEKSRRILQRLLSFDINNDSMVRELSRKLQWLSKGAGMQHGSGANLDHEGKTRLSDGGQLFPTGPPTSVTDMQSVVHLLREGYGIGEWVDVDFSIVRGLHYYTGVVFEAFDSEGVFRAILGGGCYGEPETSLAGLDKTAEGPSFSTESPGGSTMHLNTHMLSNQRMMRAAVTGAGLGMGDCVLMELLQRKGLLPFVGSTVDVIVAFRQKAAAQHPPGKASDAAPHYVPNDNHRNLDTDRSRDKLCNTTPSTADTVDSHSVAAQQLCCKLRALGLRVELLLPPERSERAAIKHAMSVGAKAAVFVAESAQKLPMLETYTQISGKADLVSPSLPSGAEEMTKPAEFQVFLNSEGSRKSTIFDKQYQTNQAEGFIAFPPQRAGNLKRAKTFTTIPAVVEMLKAHLCPSSQGRQPSG